MRSNKSKDKSKRGLTKEKVTKFLDKQGFYIVLFLCIAIIGGTAYMTSGKNRKPLGDINKNNQNIEGPKEITDRNEIDPIKQARDEKIHIKVRDSLEEPINDKEDSSVDVDGKENKDNSKDESGKAETTEAGDEEARETIASQGQEKEDIPTKTEDNKPKQTGGGKATYPVQGKIIKAHSMDELVYSNTLKEWTTHSGIDIETFVGSEVKAAMAGVVEEIVEDSLMGITITLDHGNGLKTYYANLSTGNMVTTGQKVDKGQIISGVGRTAALEILDNPHLHFEVIKDGQTVDPDEYLN